MDQSIRSTFRDFHFGKTKPKMHSSGTTNPNTTETYNHFSTWCWYWYIEINGAFLSFLYSPVKKVCVPKASKRKPLWPMEQRLENSLSSYSLHKKLIKNFSIEMVFFMWVSEQKLKDFILWCSQFGWTKFLNNYFQNLN